MLFRSAVVVREFDLRTKQFLSEGFSLPEAKTYVAYDDDENVVFGTDFGAGSLTDSGYPRIVKLWKRGSGVPLTSAQTIFEGTAKDVSVSPVILRGTNKTHALLVRSVDFYQSEYRYVSADGSTFKLPLSEWADVKGMTGGQMLATLRKDWQPEGQANIQIGRAHV